MPLVARKGSVRPAVAFKWVLFCLKGAKLTTLMWETHPGHDMTPAARCPQVLPPVQGPRPEAPCGATTRLTDQWSTA